MIYLDASYIVKCYLREIGTSAVMALVQGATGCSSAAHARIEVWSAIHRRMRDKTISFPDARDVWRQFEQDETLGVWRWLSLTHIVIRRACDIFKNCHQTSFCAQATNCISLALQKIDSSKFTVAIGSCLLRRHISDSTALASIELAFSRAWRRSVLKWL